MTELTPGDFAVVSELLGADIARQDAPAVAASIADLRAGLPEFRRVAAELMGAAEADDD